MPVPRRVLISLVARVSGNVNADAGIGTRIPLKKIITWNQEIRPFISARCIRRCIRERLYEKGFPIDPLTMVGSGARQQLGDIGDPVKYIDDDIFGFLLPQEPPIRRSSPIKISHLISLRHTEVKVEFAARFQRDFLPEYAKGYPAPFEIEIADWLGKLNVVITDRIGRFSEEELSETAKKKLGGKFELPQEERKKRLSGFLEILLWEGWEFPRAAQSPSVPEFYYAVIGLTDRFAPIFGYVDVNDKGELDKELIERLRNIHGRLLEELFILDYKSGKYTKFTYAKKGEGIEEKQEEVKPLDSKSVSEIISRVCNYLIGADA
jgi:CRISPR-associated protein Cst2